MIVLVTGGCGFVGLNIVRRLFLLGVEEIRLVDNLSNSTPQSLASALGLRDERGDGRSNYQWTMETPAGKRQLSLTVADIRDASVADTVCADVQAVVHLAAQTGVQASLTDPAGDAQQNVVGTINYLEACRRREVPLFLAASSLAVAGDAPSPQVESRAARPLSPYAAGKAALESYCAAYWKSFGVRAVPFRFANLYGPFAWRKGSVVAAFCKRALAGKPLVVEGDGRQTRDFVYAQDVAEVVASIIGGNGVDPGGELVGQPINLATGVQTSILDLAQAIQKEFAAAGSDVAVEYGPARAADVRESAPDVARRRTLLPNIRFHTTAEKLPETIRWFMDNRASIAK